ncbi:hypothetical protein [Streptomyces sp. NPDC058240]|uniref:hypothetical protein n=1 Tax=Streptomyces sp. NPDC058240 TaxID=3346396 RepID=UPI0036EC476C
MAHLAKHHQARVTGVDLVDLQIHRARSQYGHTDGATFAVGHALHHLQATGQTFGAIHSVLGAVGLGPVLSSDHRVVGRLRSQRMEPRRWSPAA